VARLGVPNLLRRVEEEQVARLRNEAELPGAQERRRRALRLRIMECPATSSVIELENPDGGKLPLIVRRVNVPFGLTG
jgi:hypothetical protein